MFWGLIMESGKRYTQTVERAFHVSMACLEPSTADNDNVSVLLVFDSREFILCNLNKHKVIQTPLDLNFQSGDKIAFMSTGEGRVHLTGYLLETDDEEDEDEDLINNEDSILDSDSFVEKGPKGNSKRKNEPQLSKAENKKAKLDELESDEEISSFGDDDDDISGDSEDSEDEEDDDEDDDEEDDEADSEDEEMETSPKQATPDSKKNKQVIKTPNEKQQKNKSLIEQQQKNKTPNEKQQQKNKTPNDKQQQKNKTPNEKQQLKKTPNEKQQLKKTPNEKQQQKIKTPNEKYQQEGTPKSSPGTQINGIAAQQQSGKKNKKGQETPKGAKTPGADSPQKKLLEGGVSIQEVRVGNGPVAKPGREVSVYYVGRLKHNNKQFDSTTQGSGFKFRLGRGEVIKGWDIGVSGMKVGGKRKIVCPASLAYGSKGSPPAIPPNSNLVFDVELRAVN